MFKVMFSVGVGLGLVLILAVAFALKRAPECDEQRLLPEG